MRRITLIFLFTLFLVPVLHASGDGWFGLAFKVDADGLFNPTIRSIKVEKVFPNSPAAKAGLLPDDLVVGIDGITVAGAQADALKKAMHKPVGATLRLEIKRGSAEPRAFTLTAARKP